MCARHLDGDCDLRRLGSQVNPEIFLPGGNMVRVKHALTSVFAALGLLSALVFAQERRPTPYFVAYDHYMEEPGAL